MKDQDYGVQTHALREQIEALEFKAERAVQDALVLRIVQWNSPARLKAVPGHVISNVITYYAANQLEMHLRKVELQEVIDIIARAAAA